MSRFTPKKFYALGRKPKGEGDARHDDLLRLMNTLHYEPETGLFRYKVRRGNSKVGDVAGTRHCNGYVQISFQKRFYLAHRLALAFAGGAWPTLDVDHINGEKSDNRLCNLRQATVRTNMENIRKARSGSASGLLGVHWNERSKQWHAKIQVSGISKYLGAFNCPNEAHDAYITAKRHFHPGGTI